MVRLVIGSVAAALAMFVAGFIFWATPLMRIGYSQANEAQSAAVQQALASNLPHTGVYIVPDPGTQGGTVLYGRGPVATVDYNSAGFAVSDGGAMIGGLVHEWVVALMIGLTLLAVADRVTDFPSRARLVIGLSAAAAVLFTLSQPIFNHGDWRFAIYNLVATLAMLCAGGLVIARWFLPRSV